LGGVLFAVLNQLGLQCGQVIVALKFFIFIMNMRKFPLEWQT